MVMPLLEGVPARLLGQPFNMLRLAFHPEALAARTVNLAEWCGHLLERLHRQCEATADPELIKLYHELKAYPIPARSAPLSSDNVAIPFKMRLERRGPELHLDHDDVRHAGRYHAVGTGAGDVLSGRRSDRRADAGDGRQSQIARLVRVRVAAYFWGFLGEEAPMSSLKPLKIDIVSDVVCPWCYIGKRRIENALALVPDVPVEVHWRPFFLNSWVPREGISRDEYLTAKFGSVEAYKGIAGRVVAAAGEEGLTYRPELVKRQPNTIDCHRLIHWAEAQGKSAEMKQRLMELYFRDGGDLTDVNVLVQAAADVGLDADDVRRRLATDEDVALISGRRRKPPTRASPACRPLCSRRNMRCPAPSRPTSSPAPSARCRPRSTRRRRNRGART